MILCYANWFVILCVLPFALIKLPLFLLSDVLIGSGCSIILSCYLDFDSGFDVVLLLQLHID